MSSGFADLGVASDLVGVLDSRGIASPFPIQSATLPDALAGRDICGKAPTGSGKTLAFGLATIQRVDRAEKKRPRALIMAPTRELAVQIRDELEPYADERNIRLGVVYGGTSVEVDIRRLNKGIDVLVATPGRLEDLIDRGSLLLNDIDIAVIDEADRMADMGFLPVVKRILDQTAQDRQTLLFSATLDGDVDVLVKRYQVDPSRHEVEDEQFERGDVRHYFLRTTRTSRVVDTANILAGYESAVVFCRTRRGTDRLAKQLNKEGISCDAIHGDLSQAKRERALKKFSAGKVRALCATDVAARGIHIDDVSCVVHFDPPGMDKDYIHRSGRTGRAGADGVVFSMVVKEQEKAVKALQRDLGLEVGFDDLEVAPRSLDERTPIEVVEERKQKHPKQPKQERAKKPAKKPAKKERTIARSFTKEERAERAADAQKGGYIDVDPRKKKREWLSDEEYDKLIELGEAPPRRKRRNHKDKAKPKGRRKPSSRNSAGKGSASKGAKSGSSSKKRPVSAKKKAAKRKAASAKASPQRKRR